jgi:hypothetical protein
LTEHRSFLVAAARHTSVSFEYLQNQKFRVQAVYIPATLNSQAAILSRPDKFFACFAHRFQFPPKLAAFAILPNMQLPIVFASVPRATAAGLDAFNQCGDGRLLHLFPPFILLPRVIQRLSPSHQSHQRNLQRSLLFALGARVLGIAWF